VLLHVNLQPLVSARGALYDIMWNETALRAALGYGRNTIMKDDIHPAFIGEALSYDMLQYACMGSSV
jgi:hypothetical protein